ncbi:hypothetical protein EPI10_032452 [Gossypium australe]|uniref:Uncharacterized protein n=1 Tax=Gossypium australe TaxID=47621 RepID=A0A5B6X753_9ROSI|nr:hypothetical protein EPI10_032452 [Gossypium australe]
MDVQNGLTGIGNEEYPEWFSWKVKSFSGFRNFSFIDKTIKTSHDLESLIDTQIKLGHGFWYCDKLMCPVPTWVHKLTCINLKVFSTNTDEIRPRFSAF